MKSPKLNVLDRLVLAHLDASPRPQSASEIAGHQNRMEVSVAGALVRLEMHHFVVKVLRPKTVPVLFWATVAGRGLVRRSFK